MQTKFVPKEDLPVENVPVSDLPKEFTKTLRPDLEAQFEGQGIEANPWVDPTGVVAGGMTQGLMSVGTPIQKLITGTLGTITGSIAEPVVGTAAEKIEESLPVSVRPYASLPLGVLTGIAGTKLIEKPITKGLTKGVTKAAIKTVPLEDMPEPKAGELAFGQEVPELIKGLRTSKIVTDAEPIDDAARLAAYGSKKLLSDTAERYAGTIDEARRGKMTWEGIQELARQLDMQPDELVKRTKGMAYNAEKLEAAKGLLADSANKLNALRMTLAGKEELLTEDIFNFRKALDYHAALQASFSGARAEAGRALNILRKETSAQKTVDQYKAILDAVGGRKLNEEIIRKFMSIDPNNTEQLNKFIRRVHKASTFDMIHEAWLSSLLSGAKTNIVNTTSNALTALSNPILETPIASTIDLARSLVTGKPRERFFGEVPHMAFGMWQGLKDGMRAFARTWATELPTDSLMKLDTTKPMQAIPSKVFKEGAEKTKVKFLGKEFSVPFTGEIEVGGKQIRIPLRLLSATDEFFKSVIYRGELQALAYREAKKEGGDITGRVADLLQNPTREMIDAAKKEAEYRTFTKPLGKYGNTLLSLKNTVPTARYLIPFVRTPLNIAKYALERTPFEFARIGYDIKKKGLSAGELSDRLARPVMGSMIAAVVVQQALEGNITGAGPKDKDERAKLFASGWQPYSLKIRDKYYQFNRLEPVGSLMGMAAQYVEDVIKKDEKAWYAYATGMISAISKNITSKTFMTSLSLALDAASNPDQYLESWLESQAGTLVPNVVGQVVRSADPMIRDIQGPLESIQSRLPGQYTNIPPKFAKGRPLQKSGDPLIRALSPVNVTEISSSLPFVQRELEASQVKRDRKNELKDLKRDILKRLWSGGER